MFVKSKFGKLDFNEQLPAPLPYLFVYGTLMKGIDSTPGRYLLATSKFVGEGVIPGHLFDMGQYPAARYLPEGRTRVFGHLFLMENPSLVLSQLDEYEGLGEADCEYSRQIVEVFIDGQIMQAWAYLLADEVEERHLRSIPGGNYLRYWESNARHQRFTDSL